jgi:hypothetical protein
MGGGFPKGFKMAVLQWGLFLFLGAFLAHLLVWRVRKPTSPLKALLVIFVAAAAVGLTVVYFGERAVRSIGLAVLPNAAAYLHVLLFFTSVALAYMVSYTLLEWDSPTLTLVTMIAKAGKDGVGEVELLEYVDKLPFIESRVESLMRDNSLVYKDGYYVVGPGRHVAYRFVLFYRRLLGTERRGG